ncbi:MAG: Nif11-like leader peptide family RiPP precursor [Waterburya sp.]
MSIHNAKALYTRLLVDEEFRKQLERAASYQERYDILQTAGFACTPTELNIAKNELLRSLQTEEELSESEQESIMGGSSVQSLQSLLTHFDSYLFKEK